MGLLETLGLKKRTITQQMVDARRAEVVAAVKLLQPFMDTDETTKQIVNQFAVRLANITRSSMPLEMKFEEITEIKQEAEAALKPAKTRNTEREMRDIAAGPDGLDMLDTMVEALGGSAKTPEAKEMVKAALKARFNIDSLEGEMTTKALPKLYKVLGSVPEWQVRDNESLKNIKRVKSGPEGASIYYKEGDDKTGRPGDFIYLELGRTGTFAFNSENYKTDDGTKTKVDSFSVTTLHEIGHAVDDKLNFMGGHENVDKYGGWKKEKREDIATIVATQKGFLVGWERPYDARPLTKVLDGVLDKGKIDLAEWDRMSGEVDRVFGVKTDEVLTAELLADPGVVLAETAREAFTRDNNWPPNLDANVNAARPRVDRKWGTLRQEVQTVISTILERKVPAAAEVARLLSRLRGMQTGLTPNDRAKLETHPAVELCRAIRIKGSNSGLWDEGASAAGKWAIDSRVYQQAYSTSWVSYAVGVRPRGISQYQFRAPGEWFAELYAMYYLKKLPKTHADAVWMAAEIDVQNAPARVGG
jgi:Trp operon repressor